MRSAGYPAAPQIALIHPLALDETVWNSVSNRLAAYASVLTYDCRGHGRSGKTSTYDFTTELFARDLEELLDYVGWESCAVAGCSMGGCVAQAFAGLFPERLLALGLIDTTAYYGPNAVDAWEVRAAQVKNEGLRSRIEAQVTRWFGDDYRKEHPRAVSELISVFLANDPNCYEAACRMLGKADLRKYQSTIDVPVAIVVGEHDFATPVSMSRQLNEAIADSTLAIIPHGRHLTPVECPQQVAKELIQLIKRVPDYNDLEFGDGDRRMELLS